MSDSDEIPMRAREYASATVDSNPFGRNQILPSNGEPERSLMTDSSDDNVYEVNYYYSQAMKALIIHFLCMIFGPFSICLLRKVFSNILLKNMFFQLDISYFLYDFPNFLCIIFSFALMAFSYTQAEFLFPVMKAYVLVLSIRVLMVALKYGYYTKKHWKQMNTKQQTRQELLRTYLIYVWIKIPEDVMKQELFFAFKRIKVNPALMFFKFKTTSESFNEYILSYTNQSIANNQIPVSCFTQHIIKNVIKKLKPTRRYLIFILACLYALIPIGLIVYENGTDIDLGILEFAFILFCFPLTTLNCNIFLTFLLIGIYDFNRKKLLMSQCTALLNKTDTCYLCLDGFFPKLDVLDLQTIMSWYYMRNVFLDFGKRYTLRIFLYFSLILPVCVFSCILIILATFGLIGEEVSHLFIPGVYLVVVVIVFLSYIISSAVSLNKYFAIHRDVLLSLIAEIRMLQCFKKLRVKENEKAVRTMNLIVEKLKQDELLHPVKVLGIKLDSSLYTKLGALVFSGLFALLRNFLS